VELPAAVDVDRVSAEFRNGLLEIAAPKAQSAAESPKQIEISKGS
jgi:HSP20 family molecular chaperone IbpA